MFLNFIIRNCKYFTNHVVFKHIKLLSGGLMHQIIRIKIIENLILRFCIDDFEISCNHSLATIGP